MSNLVKYKTDAGLEIQLTTADVVRYFVSGGGEITDIDAEMFLEKCRSQGINPFLGEAYLIKYGNDKTKPATFVTGKETFTKRAASIPEFDGFKAGITIINNGQLQRREGSMVLPGETLVGGWAEVHVKDRSIPAKEEVSLAEYNKGQSQWKTMPATMIRKVALVHALREAFPAKFSGLYDAPEMGVGVPDDPITIPQAEYTVTDILPTMPPQQPPSAASGGPNNPLLNDVARMLQEYKTRLGYRFEEALGVLESRLQFKLTDVGDNQALADAAMYEARRMLDEMESTPGIDDLAPEDILF